MTRSEAREQAFILIFEKSFNGDVSLGELYEMAVETEIAMPDAFTEALAYGVPSLSNIKSLEVVKDSKKSAILS